MTLRLRYHMWLAVLVVVASVTAVPGSVPGQDEQPAAAPPAAEPAAEQPRADDDRGQEAEETSAESDDNSASILNMILGSGATGVAFMGVLGLFSIVAVTVAVERAINMPRSRIMPTEFVEELERLARQPGTKPESFAQLCSNVDAPIATILKAGLLRKGRSLLEVEKSMEDAAAREMAELRAKVRPLSTVGSIAPLVGLLGTVVGMIIAFHTASQAGLGKAELLAKGIYMALLTTAGGLSVAIPALLLAAFFGGRVEKFVREMDVRLMEVMPCLARSGQEVPAELLDQAPVQESADESTEKKSTPPTKKAPRKSTNPLMSMDV